MIVRDHYMVLMVLHLLQHSMVSVRVISWNGRCVAAPMIATIDVSRCCLLFPIRSRWRQWWWCYAWMDWDSAARVISRVMTMRSISRRQLNLTFIGRTEAKSQRASVKFTVHHQQKLQRKLIQTFEHRNMFHSSFAPQPLDIPCTMLPQCS